MAASQSQLCRQLLGDYPVVVNQQVAWGEMDSMGHVNNSVYFRYFETVRIAYLRQIGFISDPAPAIGPILASTSCRFRAALKFPDDICIGARVIELADERLTMKHAVASAAQNRIVADGEGIVVAYNYQRGEKAMFGKEISKAIKDLEGDQLKKK